MSKLTELSNNEEYSKSTIIDCNDRNNIDIKVDIKDPMENIKEPQDNLQDQENQIVKENRQRVEEENQIVQEIDDIGKTNDDINIDLNSVNSNEPKKEFIEDENETEVNNEENDHDVSFDKNNEHLFSNCNEDSNQTVEIDVESNTIMKDVKETYITSGHYQQIK